MYLSAEKRAEAGIVAHHCADLVVLAPLRRSNYGEMLPLVLLDERVDLLLEQVAVRLEVDVHEHVWELLEQLL